MRHTCSKMPLLSCIAGTLLKDWFHYYGTSFDYPNEVITIQHDTNKHVLKTSIVESSLQPEGTKSVIFRPSALCVQDPFELCHNLTQNVSVETLTSFVKACQEAYNTLSKNSTEQRKEVGFVKTSSIIELFTQPSDAKQKSKKSSYMFTIPCVKSEICVNPPIRQTCKFIMDILSELNITMYEIQPDERADMCRLLKKAATKVEPSNDVSGTEDDMMCVDEDTTCKQDFSLASRKRPHEIESSNDGDAKRLKSNHESETTTYAFLCSASQITWQNRRRQRRLQAANNDMIDGFGQKSTETTERSNREEEMTLNKQPLVVPGSATTSSSPVPMCLPHGDTNEKSETVVPNVIEFQITISENTDEGASLSARQQCNVVLNHLKGSFQHFSNFYAFFKKFTVQNIPMYNDERN